MGRHDHNGTPGDAVVRAEQHESESRLQTILRAVAIEKNVSVGELSSLYEQIDPEAMVELLDRAERRNVETTIEFTFEGRRVAVSQDGTVRIRRLT
ncbi:HalOD1 output domain-containing protein [Natronobacterium gregoryi]|uniref:Halobacterial output domain-containing protein n=2 Tax=Natronobacterium gregoryi TaxID=44930 RepID=L0AK99_NATGS|nr:HalOD1 output domain-containing protein [Natronobacterium gregoryi]AFZ74216.1 hypothetical protein Natgr_3082 [Natronobacterium gregoryi SP2]ELY63671.1 hypothetical protein C490_15514 [Natronobacterium gregoryi SP2]PLK21996.1 hypothetical protein CYV19_00965 [Natronobacterium gregoryi SP2]SFI51651.1 hypothetical protein SAMN05443661_101102 [Natronobacterium gregoryi]